MDIISDPAQLASFFLVGARANPGHPVDIAAGFPGERVGVLVLKQTVRSDGSVDGAEAVLDVDEGYSAPTFPEFIRLESDLCPNKSNFDVVVVRALADVQVPVQFGELAVNGTVVTSQLLYGWQDRKTAPRLAYAYDPAIWDHVLEELAFDPETELLPKGYANAFCNGGFIASNMQLLNGHSVRITPDVGPIFDTDIGPGAVLRFTQNGVPGFNELTIPDAPQLSVTLDDDPLSPQPDFNLRVDTVVYDTSASQFLVVWRGAIDWGSWESVLELAALEVS